MSQQAKLGFIGLGAMGSDLLSETVKNPKADVVALCDLEQEALDKAVAVCDNGPETYTDYRELLQRDDIDGVVVAVPQNQHAQISIDALDAGKTTYCEKPMALSVAQCETMIAAAERNEKGLMIGQVLRYIGVYRHVLELVESGEFGKAFAVRIIRSGGGWGEWVRDWRLKRETSGGLLMEINAHEIDFMLHILGEATAVSAVGSRFINHVNDYEDFITANVTFAGGGLANVTTTSCDFLGRYTGEVFLEKGTIYYDGLSATLYTVKQGEEKQEVPYGDIHPEWESGMYREMREFVEACLGEQPVTIPGEDGMRVVEVAEACYRSINEGGPVALPLPRA